ncbi:helix-turn-helix domain-containing protein [Corynebacterium parakroppenstedtii]|uniref:helix-turn-helix domain-containing protein n=1 Tax=Corynebacterium parakroppenstedtii TaxID=2828363 RepID=UPI001C8D1662|nr:helix-turn-helix domain-containing protein [Corynebacterium parakroppenstedtii]MBY0797275.1 helix-turn-helix domain-containing protein [Corynebacterium parakroppenstedtii]
MNKDEALEQLRDVSIESAKLLEQRDTLVYRALTLGASISTVAEVTGLSRRTVSRIKTKFTE